MAVIAVVVALGINSNNSAKPAPRVALHRQPVASPSSPCRSTIWSPPSTSPARDWNPATQLNDQPLTSGGKPEVLFIGAEFCPICATERWPLTVALSQFGKFTNLHQTRSAVHDGNIATVTFYGSTYSSPYLTFTPVETTTNVPKGNYYETLQTPTAAQQALWSNTSQALGISEGFPFVYMGGKYVLTTSQFDPSTLEGKSFDEISGDVGNNDTSSRRQHRRLGGGPDQILLHPHGQQAGIGVQRGGQPERPRHRPARRAPTRRPAARTVSVETPPLDDHGSSLSGTLARPGQGSLVAGAHRDHPLPSRVGGGHLPHLRALHGIEDPQLPGPLAG